jgi:peptidoglycan/xylan/chitin deacetylase (PgdA/CDA1 family)
LLISKDSNHPPDSKRSRRLVKLTAIILVIITLVLVSGVLSAINSNTLLAAINSNRLLPAVNSNTLCNCVVFILRGISNDPLDERGILSVSELFRSRNLTLTLATSMQHMGTGDNLGIRDKIYNGSHEGLFELVLQGWNNTDHANLGVREQRHTFSKADDKMKRLFEIESQVVVPPFGRFNDDTIKVMQQLGFRIIVTNPVDRYSFDEGKKIFFATERAQIEKQQSQEVYRLPTTVSFKEHLTNKIIKVQSEEILDSITAAVATHGYAVVALHPKDFLKTDENGKLINSLDEREIKDLSQLIDSLLSKNYQITSLSKVVGISQNNHILAENQIPHASILVHKQGNTTIVKTNYNETIYNGTDSTFAIQEGINFLSEIVGQDEGSTGEIFVSNGEYEIKDTLNFTRNLYFHGQGNATVLDFTNIGSKNRISMAEGSMLEDIKVVGSTKPLPPERAKGVLAANNTIIKNVVLSHLGYGIETARTNNVTIIDIKCEYIQGDGDRSACIHGGRAGGPTGVGTTNLNIMGFTVVDSNRGIELDAGSTNITAQNGYLLRIKTIDPAKPAFTLDAHSHIGEGGVDNITYKNVYIKDSFAPFTKVGRKTSSGELEPKLSDFPRNVLFENVTLVNPTSRWQVQGIGVTIKDSRVINGTENILVLFKNTKNVLIENLQSDTLSTNKKFIVTSKRSEDIGGIENITITSSVAIVNGDKKGSTMSFGNVTGLNLINNTIINAPTDTLPIDVKGVSMLEAYNNRIIYANKTQVAWNYP